jgi:hypothetical protein
VGRASALLARASLLPFGESLKERASLVVVVVAVVVVEAIQPPLIHTPHV